MLRLEGGKSELCATRLKGRNDLTHVVTDKAKARIGRVLFHYCVMKVVISFKVKWKEGKRRMKRNIGAESLGERIRIDARRRAKDEE